MWAFVLLMIWLIFFGSLKTGDKVYNGVSKALNNQANELFKQYSVPDSELHDIDRKLATIQNKEFEEVRNEIREVIGVEPHYEQIKWGYFAKKGKVPTLVELGDIFSIFNSISSSGRYCDESWEQLFYEEKCEAHLKFLKWYDKTLRNNGFPYELMYAIRDKNFYAHVRDSRPISECKSIEMVVTFWKPFVRLTAYVSD